jgi:hypothetical protein
MATMNMGRMGRMERTKRTDKCENGVNGENGEMSFYEIPDILRIEKAIQRLNATTEIPHWVLQLLYKYSKDLREALSIDLLYLHNELARGTDDCESDCIDVSQDIMSIYREKYDGSIIDTMDRMGVYVNYEVIRDFLDDAGFDMSSIPASLTGGAGAGAAGGAGSVGGV